MGDANAGQHPGRGRAVTALAPAGLVFSGNLAARGLGFLFPVLVAHALRRDDFAAVVFLVNTGFAVGELVLTGFPTALTRELAADRPGARPGSLAAAVAGGLPLLGLSIALGAFLAIQADASPLLLALVVAGLSVDAYYFAALRGLQRFGLLVAYRVSANLAQLGLLGLAWALGLASEALAISIYAGVYLLPIALIEWRIGPVRGLLGGTPRPTRAQLASLTRFAIPALVSGTAYGAIVGLDVFFVRVLAPGALADYGAARSLALPITLVPFSITVVLLPRVAAAAPEARLGLLRLAMALSVAALALAELAYALLADRLVSFAYPPAYADSARFLPLLALAFGLVGIYSILSQWWLGRNRPWPPALSLVVGAATTAIAHSVLTAGLGSTGAAMSIAVGALAALVLLGVATMSGQPAGADRRERVFLVGYYGIPNLGDQAIRGAIEAAAPGHGATIERVAVRDRRPVGRGEVRLSWTGWPRYLAAILRSDRVVVGGGGVLKDEGLRLPLDLFVTVLAARLLGRRVTVLSVGVGPFYRPLGRRLVGWVAQLAQVVTVRDTYSRDALAALGVSSEVGADPVFVRTPPSPDAREADSAGPAGRLASGNGAAGSGVAGSRAARALVSIRPWFRESADPVAAQAAFRAAVVLGLGPLLRAGWAVHVAALYRPRDDDEARLLVEALGPRASVVDWGARRDWEGLIEQARQADVVVAMRYHALAAAVATGRPAIALVYEPKVEALAIEVDVPRLDVGDPELGRRLATSLEAWLDAGGVGGGPDVVRAPDPAAARDLARRADAAIDRAMRG